MKILSIGNSFSQDAHRYLHDTAAAEGLDFDCINLYIGGCNLQRHWENWVSAAPAYLYEHNTLHTPIPGTDQLRHVSIQEALAEGPYDIITLQQASHDSGKPETYEPYLTDLVAVLRKAAPEAKLAIHETWAYDVTSNHPNFPDYGCDQELMYAKLHRCYQDAAERIGAEIFPCGTVLQTLRHTTTFDAHNGVSLCRDGFHTSLTLGRYALAVTWITKLTGKPVQNDLDLPGSAEGDAQRRALIREVAAQVVLG